MKSPAVLGREVWRQFGFKLKRENDEEAVDTKRIMLLKEIREIMNIKILIKFI